MAKKTTTAGCQGVACGDQTCAACQVALVQEQHAAHLGALAALAEALDRLGERVAGAIAAALTLSGRAPDAPAPRPEPTAGATPAAATPPKAAAPRPALTVDAVRPVILSWITARGPSGRSDFAAVLAKFGAQKLPDVKDADLPRLLAEMGIEAK